MSEQSARIPDPVRKALLENELMRVAVLPHVGARIWQITYKPLNAELLWNNPAIPPGPQPLYASYDENWSGGWDELFPNDEACELLGSQLPDHGELWTGEWSCEPFESTEGDGLRLRFITPVTGFVAEKELLLRRSRAVMELRYRLTNAGDQPMPFLWKLHPAFAVSPAHRIDFPAMTVRLEPSFLGSLEHSRAEFPWPYADVDGRILDLRQVPDVTSRALHFFYGTELAGGWCGITDRSRRLAAGLHFDPDVFSSCWLFATHGGWNDLNVAVLEPATGYPYQMKSMIERGQARSLAAGESLATTVVFAAQEGLTSIGGVFADGTIVPGDDG